MARSFEEAVSRRLKMLHNTQISVEKASRAILKTKNMAKEIVKLWFKEFRLAADKQKLAFLHLANDIVQNSNEESAQFTKLFEPVLPPAFKETARIQSDGVRSAIAHLLIVWADRQMYPRTFLRQLRSICQRAANQADKAHPPEFASSEGVAVSPFAFSFTSALINASAMGTRSRQGGRSLDGAIAVQSTESPGSLLGPDLGTILNDYPSLSVREELHRDLQSEAIKTPETAELIRIAEFLQNAPSVNAATREAIADFPKFVSSPTLAKEAVDKDGQEAVEAEFVTAMKQLKAYNMELQEEEGYRLELVNQLRAYRSQLLDSIHGTRSAIEEKQSKMTNASTLLTTLGNHIINLPDISVFEDPQWRIEPLPSVGDLFGQM